MSFNELISEPFSISHNLTVWSAAVEARTFEAVGWNLNKVTFLECPWRSTNGWSTFAVRPPSGIPQTLTVWSSDADAIIWSWNGLKSKSNTAAECPLKIGKSESYFPGLFNGITVNGPPPPYTIIIIRRKNRREIKRNKPVNQQQNKVD